MRLFRHGRKLFVICSENVKETLNSPLARPSMPDVNATTLSTFTPATSAPYPTSAGTPADIVNLNDMTDLKQEVRRLQSGKHGRPID